jgi:hypothetical protein
MKQEELISHINQKINDLKYDEDIKILHHTLFQGLKITNKDSKISVALINIPCGGFGDVVNCKTFSDYLKEWYPSMKVKICTSAINKFKSLGIKTGDLLELKAIKKNDDGSECQPFDNLKFVKKPPHFDLMIVVPMINEAFKYKTLQKLLPNATNFNSFARRNNTPYLVSSPTVVSGKLSFFLNTLSKKHWIRWLCRATHTMSHLRSMCG